MYVNGRITSSKREVFASCRVSLGGAHPWSHRLLRRPICAPSPTSSLLIPHPRSANNIPKACSYEPNQDRPQKPILWLVRTFSTGLRSEALGSTILTTSHRNGTCHRSKHHQCRTIRHRIILQCNLQRLRRERYQCQPTGILPRPTSPHMLPPIFHPLSGKIAASMPTNRHACVQRLVWVSLSRFLVALQP